MTFHENRLLTDDSHEIHVSCLIIFRKLGKMSEVLSSAAVMICASKVNAFSCIQEYRYCEISYLVLR